MLYLLFALTFLAGILFYGMTPREDKLHLDTHQAEGMIVSFLNQHQAAKDQLYSWMGAGDHAQENSNTMSFNHKGNRGFLRAKDPEGQFLMNIFDFNARLSQDMVQDICVQNDTWNVGYPGLEGQPSGCFATQVTCVDNDGTEVNCGCVNGVAGANCVKDAYVFTYGGWENCHGTNDAGTCDRPSWWPVESNRVRKFERWRKAITNRTRGSISCGTLYATSANPGNNDWCLDNGDRVFKNEGARNPTCINPVPGVIINALAYDKTYQKDDLLLCFSKFKQGVAGIYPTEATHFYDGFSNAGIGMHGGNTWKDLTGNIDINLPKGGPAMASNKPYLMLGSGQNLNTGIKPVGPYTLTVLAAIPGGSAQLLGGQHTSIFEKVTSNGDEVFRITDSDNNQVSESACNNVPTNGNTMSQKLISWTFVVKPCEDNNANTCIQVYENAAQHTDLSATITPLGEGDTLTLKASNGNAHIYGIRYYSSALSGEQIQPNFKVDQKRFGIADVENGKLETCTVTENSCVCDLVQQN